MLRILLFSDIHYSKNSLPSEKRWFPGIVSLLGLFSARIAVIFLRLWDYYSQRCLGRFSDAVSGEKYDAAFCLGDMTPGVLESGLISDKSVDEANELRKKLFHALQYPLYFVLGNHDVGYRAPIGYKKGGMTLRSLEKAVNVYHTKPFYTVVAGDTKFCVIASSFITAGNSFGDLKKQQFAFLKNELLKNEKMFLLLHDPFVLRDGASREIIRNNLSKIEKIICGDVHAVFIGRILSFLLPFSDKIVFVPSVCGFFGLGRGFVEMKIGESDYELQYKKLR